MAKVWSGDNLQKCLKKKQASRGQLFGQMVLKNKTFRVGSQGKK
jgi:hypothetical protein